MNEAQEEEGMTDMEFAQKYALSPKEVKRKKTNMTFKSILYPGYEINKTAYIYELYTTRKELSSRQIRELACCGSEKVKKVKEMIDLNEPRSAFYKEKKIGRPIKITKEIQCQLILKGSGSISDLSLAKAIQEQFQVSIARSTLNAYRHKLGFQFKPQKQRQKLSPIQIKNRKKFVYSIFSIPNFPWRTIVFSDESRICLKSDRYWVWRRRGDVHPDIFLDKQKYPTGIMVYGAIGMNYKSKLVFTTNEIKSDVYVGNIELSGMLEDLKDRDYIFMQDGATCHTSQLTKDWLHSRCDFIIFWPSNSPDLNPIEMLWGIIKAKLNHLPYEIKPKNIDELIPLVQEIWDSIPMDTINSLIESFYYRLTLVAIHNGESIQSFYRHNHIHTEEECAQEVQNFLQNNERLIPLLNIDQIIMKRDIRFPSPQRFIPKHQDQPQIGQPFSPKRKKKRWTDEEDLILEQQYQVLGPKWTLIANSLPERSPTACKLRYSSKGHD